MRVIRSEWHQVEKRYAIDLDVDNVAEVYPDMDEEEAQQRFEEIANGEYDLEEFVQDAYDADVYFDWDWLDEDDWWTDRKGGYDVTYSIDE